MTLRTNARIAGVTFLVYIAAGISSMALGGRATDVLTLLTSLCALLLGVTLYAITREVNPELALFALTCRVIEALPGNDNAFFFAVGSTIFCWLLLRGRLIPAPLAWLGVVASALLVIILPLQRAKLLAGAGWSSSLTWFLWLPALVFELSVAAWFLTKGVEPVRNV